MEADSLTPRELLLEILQTAVDLERDTTGSDFQTLTLTLTIEIAILLQHAQAQPHQNGHRNERGGCQEHREAPWVHPPHAGIIAERHPDVTSWLRHEPPPSVQTRDFTQTSNAPASRARSPCPVLRPGTCCSRRETRLRSFPGGGWERASL